MSFQTEHFPVFQLLIFTISPTTTPDLTNLFEEGVFRPPMYITISYSKKKLGTPLYAHIEENVGSVAGLKWEKLQGPSSYHKPARPEGKQSCQSVSYPTLARLKCRKTSR